MLGDGTHPDHRNMVGCRVQFHIILFIINFNMSESFFFLFVQLLYYVINILSGAERGEEEFMNHFTKGKYEN